MLETLNLRVIRIRCTKRDTSFFKFTKKAILGVSINMSLWKNHSRSHYKLGFGGVDEAKKIVWLML